MNEAKYRAAEDKFWQSANLQRSEHWVELKSTGTRVRVQETGEGQPVLFIHGGPNSGSTWVPLIKDMPGFRCLVVDRPGTGLSEQYPVRAANLPDFGASFIGDVLNGLGLEQTHVVASSFGGHLALRSAAAHPERITRMVQFGAPALVPGDRLPPFMKWIAKWWVRKILSVLPPNERAGKSIMRQIGHGYSLDHNLLPPEHDEWYLALQKYTDTNKNDGNMIGSVIPNYAQLRFTEQFLADIPTPTLFIWGEDDGFGGADVANGVANAMPNAEFVLHANSGHLPWLDAPSKCGQLTSDFLNG
jgi:pimeloyl-ACP methyl ester carboxylesterase